MANAQQRGDQPALDALSLPDRVSLGLLLPVDNDWARWSGRGVSRPDLAQTTHHVRLADEVGFRAAWLRDVPTFDPTDGDPGQVFDPWTYLGYLAAVTRRITLGTAAVVTPLDHDLHLAKRAASIDVLSNGRFVLGVATGDRALEYGLFGAEYANRGERFRTTVGRLPGLWAGDQAAHRSFGATPFEMAPAPVQRRLPQIVVGRAQQSLEWIAAHADGWFSYAGRIEELHTLGRSWQTAQRESDCAGKPLMMALRVVLDANRNAPLSIFPMGVRAGMGELKRYLEMLHEAGVAHLALNLRMSERPPAQVLEEIGREPGLLNN